MTSNQTFAIVGASLAGAKAAKTLRQAGFAGRVLLLGAERERPYERPPLSKEYARGDSPREKIYIHAADFYDEHGIELHTSTPVQAIDIAARELALGSGERVRFDRLLLATGAEPRRLHVPGSDLDGVHYLRDLPDADAIAERIARGGRLVVIGGGWIGAELAASAREKDLEVTIMQRSPLPLQRVFGAQLGAIYRDLHLERGVELRSNTALEAFEGSGAVERVRTADGSTIDCDFVVAGIGVSRGRRSPRRPALTLTTASSSTNDSRRGSPGSSPRATSPTPGTRSTVAGFASSTGPMHLIKDLPLPGACSGRASPMTGCPTSTPISTTWGWSTRATRRTGTRSCSAVTRPSTSSSPSGWRRTVWWPA